MTFLKPENHPPVRFEMKPAFMTIDEWRELVAAAHSSWVGFVFNGMFLLFFGPVAVFRAYLGWAEYFGADLSWVSGDLSHFGVGLNVLLGWQVGLRVVLADIDWRGKRRTARLVGLLYTRRTARSTAAK